VIIGDKPPVNPEEAETEALETERLVAEMKLSEAHTERIESRHQLAEVSAALEYGIRLRLEQMQRERENASLWWKVLDSVFRRAGAKQEELYAALREIDELKNVLPLTHEHTPALARLAEIRSHVMEQHAVPEIFAVPPKEYSGTPVIRTAAHGLMKVNHIRERIAAKKLGEYGQDGMRINEASGTTVVFDGIEAMDDSYHVGEVVGEKLEEILHGLPDTTDIDLIEAYIHERYPEVAQAVLELPQDMQGAVVYTATRFLPKAGMLVVLKIGDGEIVLRKKEGTHHPLLASLEGKKRRVAEGVGVIAETKGNRRHAVNPPYELLVTAAKKGDRIYTTTDGVVNNTGKHLADWVAEGKMEELQRSITSQKDDVVILTQEL
jgi:hypothetical protein